MLRPQQERFLNSFPNFKLEVNGINLHFVHEVSQRPDATPLLLLHGWPGSYFEFHKMIRHLTNPAGAHVPMETRFRVFKAHVHKSPMQIHRRWPSMWSHLRCPALGSPLRRSAPALA